MLRHRRQADIRLCRLTYRRPIHCLAEPTGRSISNARRHLAHRHISNAIFFSAIRVAPSTRAATTAGVHRENMIVCDTYAAQRCRQYSNKPRYRISPVGRRRASRKHTNHTCSRHKADTAGDIPIKQPQTMRAAGACVSRTGRLLPAAGPRLICPLPAQPAQDRLYLSARRRSRLRPHRRHALRQTGPT